MTRYCLIALFLFSCFSIRAQNPEYYWIEDFSGGIRTDLALTKMPDNSAIELDNAIIEGTSLKLRPGYTLWVKRIDALSDGSNPSIVRGIRGLYEFYNDVTGETQVLAVIHDAIWWDTTGAAAWKRVGLSAGTATITQNDSIVLGINTDWWPRMLPRDGDDWKLHIGDSTLLVYRVIGNKILLEDKWSQTTAAGAEYELYPTFDTLNQVTFASSDATCFIMDGSQPAIQWKDYTIQNGYFIVDSATIKSHQWINYPNMSGDLISFSDSLELSHVDSAQDYGLSNYTFAFVDTNTIDSLRVHFCPILYNYAYDDSLFPTSIRSLYVLIPRTDTICITHAEGLRGYVCMPKTLGYFFDYDTVYSGTIDTVYGNDFGAVLIDETHTPDLDEMNAGAYHLWIKSNISEWLNSNISYCRVDTSHGTPGFRAKMHDLSLTADLEGQDYLVIRGDFYPSAYYGVQKSNRLWFARSPKSPNVIWYSELANAADLMTTNYFDDISTVNFEVVGAGDKDEIMGLGVMQQWLVPYKRHHIYVMNSFVSELAIYLKASNYGLWASGFLLPVMESHFGLNRLGLFAFNGSSVADHRQLSSNVASFFEDSLNLSRMNLVRGELWNNHLLFSFPSGSNTSNDKTLVLDTRTGAWSTWSWAAASYLIRRAPGSLDTLLWGSPDSAAIFVVTDDATTDAGTEIELTYKSPYTDFGSPMWKKQLRKVYVTGRFNALCSLGVYIYADDLTDAESVDTIAASATLGYNSPQDLELGLKQAIENTVRFSVKIVSINADSLQIDKVGFEYVKTNRVGAQ